MQPYQERVIKEKKELDDKITVLTDFMHSESYEELSAIDQGLLMVQLVAMANYSDALKRRIELF